MTQQNDCAYHFVKDHTSEAFRAMNGMRERHELCDVILKIGDWLSPAHKLVLAATSPYFHAMFTNEMVEKSSRVVEMHEIDSQALELLVEYAYTSQVSINEHNVQVLLPAACLLQITCVRDACCKFLMRQLHPANCLGIHRFADTHACEELRRLSHQFALHNFTDVCDSEEFLMLPFQDLNDLICCEELNVESEEQVFTSVLNWIQNNLEERRCHIPELMSNIRLPLLTRDFLMNYVETNDLVTSNPVCKDLLIEAMKYHLLPEKRLSLTSVRTKERRGRRSRPVIFAVGGGSLFAVHSECEYYDFSTDQWLTAASMTMRRSRAGVTVAHGKLYAIGGYDGSQDMATAECYNPKSNQWAKIAPMGTKRSCLGVCVWNGLIYVAGGYDGASCLNSVERYDPLTYTWSSVAAMTIRRRYARLVAFEDCVYAIGGYDGSSHLSSMEKFEPELNQWTAGPNMISRRSNAGVAVLNGMIYVCGGTDGGTCLSSVERFNPQRGFWEPVASMHSRRSTHDVVVLQNCLYAIGGNDGSTSLNSVEMYNMTSNKWTIVTGMNLRRSSVGASLMEIPKPRHHWQVLSTPSPTPTT